MRTESKTPWNVARYPMIGGNPTLRFLGKDIYFFGGSNGRTRAENDDEAQAYASLFNRARLPEKYGVDWLVNYRPNGRFPLDGIDV